MSYNVDLGVPYYAISENDWEVLGVLGLQQYIEPLFLYTDPDGAKYQIVAINDIEEDSEKFDALFPAYNFYIAIFNNSVQASISPQT